jgi:hypothetical protein
VVAHGRPLYWGPCGVYARTPGALWGQGSPTYTECMADRSHFMVHFANGQGDSSSGTLEEARARMRRRAEYDPLPPGVFPAEIVEYGPDIPGGRRVVERFEPGPS